MQKMREYLIIFNLSLRTAAAPEAKRKQTNKNCGIPGWINPLTYRCNMMQGYKRWWRKGGWIRNQTSCYCARASRQHVQVRCFLLLYLDFLVKLFLLGAVGRNPSTSCTDTNGGKKNFPLISSWLNYVIKLYRCYCDGKQQANIQI